MVCLILSIIYYEHKAALTWGLNLPLILILACAMGWATFMCLKNSGLDWYDKALYMNLSFILYFILDVIGFGLYSYAWSNFFLLLVNGVYFIYIGSAYNFYNREIDFYLNGGSNE